MKDLDNLKKEISELAKIQFEIDENGGIENNSILFEKYLELREAILNRFGLPESKINAQILHFKSSPSFVEIEGYIGELKKRATEYLLSPVETNEKILLDAIKSRREAEEVIPELGINLHVYSIFVYREMLLTKRENSSVIIEAMNIADEPQILNLLGTIAFAKDLGDHEKSMITDLSLKGVKFLSEFISFYHPKERDIIKNYLKLTEYLSEFNDLSNTRLLSDKFNSLASHLLNNTCLIVSNHPYRIIELEIYYYDENNHPDPYVHKAHEQLALGNWYFNGFGLDITFGNAANKIYGGILIRGIKSLGKTPKYISGPSNVLKEIFSRMGNVMSVNSGIYLSELIPINQNESNKDSNQDENYKGIIQTTRIGLPKKLEDTNNFAERQYRYLIDLNIHHKFKDKEKVVRQLYANNKLTEVQVKRIMGYNLGL